MSKRRYPEDIVLKKENAGFVGAMGRILLHHQDEAGINACMLDCGDPNCKEWANCEFVDDDDVPTGEFAYHVSECQMQDDVR